MINIKHAFITGTDTSIGKTHITMQLAKQYLQQKEAVCVLKPVATGCLLKKGSLYSEDRIVYESIRDALFTFHEGWAFEKPVSPHLAASLSQEMLSAKAIANWCLEKASQQPGRVLIEGAGGVMVPLNEKETWLDVMQLLQIQVILVVGLRLGCLNHALLTAAALEAHHVPFAGWIANRLDPHCFYPERLIETLQSKIMGPYLGEVRYCAR